MFAEAAVGVQRVLQQHCGQAEAWGAGAEDQGQGVSLSPPSESALMIRWDNYLIITPYYMTLLPGGARCTTARLSPWPPPGDAATVLRWSR